MLPLHTGTWFHLDKGEQQAWHAGIQRIYSLLAVRGPDGSFPHINKFEAALKAGYVEADEVLHIQRLRLFIQVLRIGDEHMIQAVLNNYAIMDDPRMAIRGSTSLVMGYSLAWRRRHTRDGVQ